MKKPTPLKKLATETAKFDTAFLNDPVARPQTSRPVKSPRNKGFNRKTSRTNLG